MKLVIKENIKTKKPITLNSNPDYRGADIDYDYLETLPVITLDLTKDKIEFWEKDKLTTDQFKSNVRSMISSIQKGFNPPPIVVMKIGIFKNKYRLIDGHHRVAAAKALGQSKIQARVVPGKDVRVDDGVPTLTEEEIQFMKNLPNL